MKIHELKVWPPYFQAAWDRIKTFEVRRDDRGFKASDILFLREWRPNRDGGDEGYTGREMTARITYILVGGHFGIEPGFVVLGIERMQRSTSGRIESP